MFVISYNIQLILYTWILSELSYVFIVKLVFTGMEIVLTKAGALLAKTKNEKNAVLVSNCGKENEKIYYNLEEVVEVPYFSTIIIKKGGLGE